MEKRFTDFNIQGGNYDLSPDGKRIAALMPANAPGEQKPKNHLIVLLNFFDEVRRRAPRP
jgi:hypothetical protein